MLVGAFRVEVEQPAGGDEVLGDHIGVLFVEGAQLRRDLFVELATGDAVGNLGFLDPWAAGALFACVVAGVGLARGTTIIVAPTVAAASSTVVVPSISAVATATVVTVTAVTVEAAPAVIVVATVALVSATTVVPVATIAIEAASTIIVIATVTVEAAPTIVVIAAIALVAASAVGLAWPAAVPVVRSTVAIVVAI
ncbi:MAG: hypothetical protein ACTIID_05485 [Brevibacterium linens]|uniref:hypothetical protein n=1 Tax=Brevibacterium linens TaxID=1703 RepID=UPI003F9BDFC5